MELLSLRRPKSFYPCCDEHIFSKREYVSGPMSVALYRTQIVYTLEGRYDLNRVTNTKVTSTFSDMELHHQLVLSYLTIIQNAQIQLLSNSESFTATKTR